MKIKNLKVCLFNVLFHKKAAKKFAAFFPLPDLDSNQDILNQNQLYYHYTIRQSRFLFWECKNNGAELYSQISNKSFYTFFWKEKQYK